MCWWKAHAVTVESCNKKKNMINVAAGDQEERCAREGEICCSLDSSLLYCAAAKAGSCSEVWWCYLFSWGFFQLAVSTSPLDLYWFPPLLEEPRGAGGLRWGRKLRIRVILWTRVDAGGWQCSVRAGARQWWCRRPASKTPGSQAWCCRELHFCLRRKFEVTKGGLKVLVPGLCCCLLQSSYGRAELCGVHPGQQQGWCAGCCRGCTWCFATTQPSPPVLGVL